jgi:hypothetical protein
MAFLIKKCDAAGPNDQFIFWFYIYLLNLVLNFYSLFNIAGNKVLKSFEYGHWVIKFRPYFYTEDILIIIIIMIIIIIIIIINIIK